MSNKTGTTLAWVAIGLSIIGFFVWSIPLGVIAMVLSLIGLVTTEEQGLNWTALALGAIAVILGIL